MMVGTTVSHYKVLEHVGGGGMGVVYKALDLTLDRIVALKFLSPAFAADPEARHRFTREAKAASALQHVNISTVHEVGETEDGLPFIVMDFYSGRTLKDQMGKGFLPIGSAVDIALQIARGLGCAHEHGITHRDIKPANIIITNERVVKILDFGLAKAVGVSSFTKSGLTPGTAAYMSPEQVLGSKVDTRTDIWSLGVVFYEMLTGQRPFTSDVDDGLVYAIQKTEPTPLRALRPEIDKYLENISRKMMAKRPGERYQSVAELTADLESNSSGLRPKVRIRRFRPLTLLRKPMALGVSAIVLVALGVAFLMSRGRMQLADSIAILPFENPSQDSILAYYSDGLTDDLITKLYTIPTLSVRSTRRVMQYRNTSKPPRDIAKELGVQALLTGRVRWSDDRLILSLQLTDAETDRNLWGTSYDRRPKEIPAILNEVAQTVVRVLNIELKPDTRKNLGMSTEVDPKAYELTVQGRALSYKMIPASARNAITFFNRAIEIDSNYAPAYAGLASAYDGLVTLATFPTIFPNDAWPKAKQAALKAIQKDPYNAEAYSILAEVASYYEWNQHEAETLYKRAIELNPSSAEAHALYALFLHLMARQDEARSEINSALRADPLTSWYKHVLSLTYFAQGRYEEAQKCVNEILEYDPQYAHAHDLLARIYISTMKHEKALQEIEKVGHTAAEGYEQNTYRGWLYARAGARAKAQQLLSGVASPPAGTNVSPAFLAMVYSALGDIDSAFYWIDRACEQRDCLLVGTKASFEYDPMRDDPRFRLLLKRIGHSQE
jgi:serine/threonine protein kinase/tetratricopeptide (TPR) repeat protein